MYVYTCSIICIFHTHVLTLYSRTTVCILSIIAILVEVLNTGVCILGARITVVLFWIPYVVHNIL